MLTRIRSIWLAGGGALALALTLSGVVAAATVLTVIVAPTTAAPTVVADTTATFEDLDGNGVDDDCQTDVVADPVAAAGAEAAADLDGDGTISVSEAARSGRVGGTNCNHGGYVSTIADDDCVTVPAGDPIDQSPDSDSDADNDSDADCEETVAAVEPTEEEAAKDEAPAECVAPAVVPTAAVADAVEVDPAPNAHGKTVSDVARSDAVGGKNCNHGGAVSEAAKKDHDAAKSAREAAKAARVAAKEARQTAREATRVAKHHGKNGS